MADPAPVLAGGGEPGERPAPRRGLAGLRARLSEAGLIRWLGGAGALIPALALAFILVSLILEALPAIRLNGWSFFTSSAWNPGSGYGAVIITDGIPHPQGSDFGAGPLIVGTLASSAIALVIAVPVSIGAALVIVERLPRRLGNLIGVFLELLAGIPSVIIGLWGVLTFGPFISRYIAPVIARNMPDVPVLKFFGGSTGTGLGLLNSGLILAIMVIPIIAATARDLIRQVPILPREGAMALGLSDWECARRVTLPWVGSGIIGAIVLGLGRALGETIAITLIIVPSFHFSYHVLQYGGNSIAATIALDFSSFPDAGSMGLSALMAAGLVLFAMTLIVNMLGAIVIGRSRSGISTG